MVASEPHHFTHHCVSNLGASISDEIGFKVEPPGSRDLLTFEWACICKSVVLVGPTTHEQEERKNPQ